LLATGIYESGDNGSTRSLSNHQPRRSQIAPIKV